MPKYDDQGNLIEEEEVEQLDDSQEEAQEELQEEQVEEETQDDEAEQEDEADSSGEQQGESQERQPSRREQLRINDLLRKYGNPGETPSRAGNQQGIDYRNMIDADEEVYEQLYSVSQQYGQAQYEQGLREAQKVRFETRLEVDAPRVEAKYPQLDKNSPEFNPAVASSINEMYLSAVGFDERTGYVANDRIRYADYVDAMFELVDEAASRKVETTRRNVTRQAGRTGLRPDGSTAQAAMDLNKDPSQMSDRELDAAMAKLGLAPNK